MALDGLKNLLNRGDSDSGDDPEPDLEAEEGDGGDEDLFGDEGFDDMGDMGEGGMGEGGGDPFGGGDESERIGEIENRLDDLENEVGNVSSTMSTVRGENESISQSLDEVEENVRKLLNIYEMVTQGVNPFVDDDMFGGDMMGGGGGGEGELGLFGGGQGGQAEQQEDEVDSELMDMEAEDFFDDDFEGEEQQPAGDGISLSEEDDADLPDLEEEAAPGEPEEEEDYFEEDFGEDVEIEEAEIPDTEEEDDEEKTPHDKFKELKEQEEAGEETDEEEEAPHDESHEQESGGDGAETEEATPESKEIEDAAEEETMVTDDTGPGEGTPSPESIGNGGDNVNEIIEEFGQGIRELVTEMENQLSDAMAEQAGPAEATGEEAATAGTPPIEAHRETLPERAVAEGEDPQDRFQHLMKRFEDTFEEFMHQMGPAEGRGADAPTEHQGRPSQDQHPGDQPHRPDQGQGPDGYASHQERPHPQGHAAQTDPGQNWQQPGLAAPDQQAGATGVPDADEMEDLARAAGMGRGRTETPAERGFYIRELQKSYLADIIAMRWINFLISRAGDGRFEEVLQYYVDIGWISTQVKDQLLAYRKGLLTLPRFQSDDAEPETDEDDDSDLGLTAEDHIRSLMFISRLTGEEEWLTEEDVEEVREEVEDILELARQSV